MFKCFMRLCHSQVIETMLVDMEMHEEITVAEQRVHTAYGDCDDIEDITLAMDLRVSVSVEGKTQ
jgi:hypothetical protein